MIKLSHAVLTFLKQETKEAVDMGWGVQEMFYLFVKQGKPNTKGPCKNAFSGVILQSYTTSYL